VTLNNLTALGSSFVAMWSTPALATTGYSAAPLLLIPLDIVHCDFDHLGKAEQPPLPLREGVRRGSIRSGPAQLQACWVHIIPGGVQMPQLALQQTVPCAQVVEPHFTP
jgi:hypothetical protein